MVRLSKAALFGLLTGVVGLVVTLTPIGLNLEENVGLDALFKLRGERQAPSDVIIVSIDKLSTTLLDLPDDPNEWPRSLHARLIENLTNIGAVVIAFDMIFDKARAAADDQAFAEAVRQAGNVVLFESVRGETLSVPDKTGAGGGVLHLERRVPPIPPLVEAAVALAPFPLPKVPVKVSQYWTFKTGAGDTPTLPVVAFQIFASDVYDEFVGALAKVSPSQAAKLPRNQATLLQTRRLEESTRVLRDIFTDEPLTAQRILAELQVASTRAVDSTKARRLTSLIHMYQSANSQFLNFYGRPGTIRTIPYYQILQAQETLEGDQGRFDFTGKAVFVGLSEYLRPEQKDGFYTVFSRPNGVDISGVEIAATAFANLLEDFPVRPLRAPGHLATVVLWGVLLGVVCRLLPTLSAAVSVLGLGALYLVATLHQFTTTGSWYPLLVPLCLQVPLAFFGAVLWRYVEANKERQTIRKAFAHYLPEKVIDQLLQNVAAIKTTGQMVYGTCLYTDAEHYTPLAEAMEPQALSGFMNQYYEAIFAPVRQHGGIVQDVVGDAVLAIWATPHPDATLRRQACLAALDIVRAIQKFNQSADTLRLPTRMGLHTGHMLLGNVGAIDHYEYRAVGDIVVTTTRIEGLNKYLGTGVLVSTEVLHQLEDFLTRELGAFLLVGKQKPLVIHELLCRLEESDEQQRSLCKRFAEALGAYRRQSWDEAIEQFYGIISSSRAREDGPSLFYVKLCEQYRTDPPQGPWNGVVRLGQK